MGSLEEEPRDFPSLPPFPKDVPTVPLHRISLHNLLLNDEHETKNLFRACKELGFFYLDLRSPTCSSSPTSSSTTIPGATLQSLSSALFSLGAQVFDLPTEEKQQYDLRSQNSYFGYKGLGAGVIDTHGTADRNEFYNISKDDILSQTLPPLPNPPLLQTSASRNLLSEFIVASHGVVKVILKILNEKLGLPEGVLEGLHRLEAISGDQVRWVRSPPQKRNERQVALGEHTDFGSVTVLFNRLGGLQVLPPKTGDEEEEGDGWKYVRPLEGCCVVNLGDAMVKFSRGILRSNIHRVVNPPGEQEIETRYSLVYFARPEDDVLLRGLEGSAMIDAQKQAREEGEEEEGGNITAKEWILRRALSRRVGGDFEKSFGTDRARLDQAKNGKRDSGVIDEEVKAICNG